MPRTAGGAMTMMFASAIADRRVCAARTTVSAVHATRLTFVERRQGEEERRRIAGVRGGGGVETAERRDVLDARNAEEIRDGPPHHRIGARQ